MNQAQHPVQFGLPKLPTWALLALIAAAFLFMGHLDDQRELDTPETAKPPQRTAATMAEAIAMACHSHGANGRENRYGDVQCFDSNGRPTFYVHISRVRP